MPDPIGGEAQVPLPVAAGQQGGVTKQDGGGDKCPVGQHPEDWQGSTYCVPDGYHIENGQLVPDGQTGGTTGGSSGGSVGGGTAADPNAPLIAEGKSLYLQLWGQAPPANLIEGMVHNGLNIWQMEDRWRHDPSFLKTKTAKNEADQWAAMLHQIGVA